VKQILLRQIDVLSEVARNDLLHGRGGCEDVASVALTLLFDTGQLALAGEVEVGHDARRLGTAVAAGPVTPGCLGCVAGSNLIVTTRGRDLGGKRNRLNDVVRLFGDLLQGTLDLCKRCAFQLRWMNQVLACGIVLYIASLLALPSSNQTTPAGRWPSSAIAYKKC
jgi:hypothetical protein